jgi:glucosamine--fructose-6-phosphate aminotransferase (isomerizing)
MGSSYHALHPLQLHLVERGLTSVVVETSELLHYQRRLLDEATLLVIASQSGRSVEVVRLLEARSGATVLGLTNTPDSPLAQEADAAVLTCAGDEATVSCKTYLAAQLALAWLTSVLEGAAPEAACAPLRPVVPAVADYLASWRDHVAVLARELDGIRDLFLVGRGPSLAAAGTGGLIVKESTHLHSEGMSAAAFRHGPMEMTSSEVLVLAFAGDGRTRALNERLVSDVRAAGGRAALISDDAELPAFRLPKVPAELLQVVELLPVEMITLSLAALKGHEAGRFTIAGKVTTTE